MRKRLSAVLVLAVVLLVAAVSFVVTRPDGAEATRHIPATAAECEAKGGHWQQSNGFYGCFPAQPTVEDGGSVRWQGPRD